MTFTERLTRWIEFFYVPLLRPFLPIQTFKYAVCGGGNLLLNLLLYAIVFHFVLQKAVVQITPTLAISPHIASSWIVFPITFFTGFWLQKHIAFRHSPLRSRTQLLRYLFSVAGSFVLDYLLLKLFVEQLEFYPTPSKALTIILVTLYSYLMQKYFTFRGAAS